jgi:hypothetical protein
MRTLGETRAIEERTRERNMNVTLRRALFMCVLALILAAMAGSTALADPPRIVEPDTLTPPPGEGVVAECKETGNYIICQTFFDEPSLVNEPAFELSCGTVYETSNVHREGIRWYSPEGLLLKRFVREDAEGTLSLSATGEGPTVRFFAHDNWTDIYTTPGDEESASTTSHGVGLRIIAPGSGGPIYAGITLPNGMHHGVPLRRDLFTGEDVAAEADALLCEALQP